MDGNKIDDIPHNINIGGGGAKTLKLLPLDQSLREAGDCLGCIFQLLCVCEYALDLNKNQLRRVGCDEGHTEVKSRRTPPVRISSR